MIIHNMLVYLFSYTLKSSVVSVVNVPCSCRAVRVRNGKLPVRVRNGKIPVRVRNGKSQER